MPIYEYRCVECEDLFELRRPAQDAGAEATCPSGHRGARRVLSRFAATGRAAAPMPAGSAGGCGAGCACAAAAAGRN